MVGRLVGGVVEGVTTGSGVNTIVDTGRGEAADFWPGGCGWLLATGATYEVLSGGAGSVVLNGGGTVGAGVKYAVTGRDWGKAALRQAVNLALMELGPYLTYTDLTTVGGQEAYALTMAERAVVRVELAQELSAPYEWMLLTRYQLGGGEVRFDEDWQPAVGGYKLRVWWLKQPAELVNDGDVIPGEYDDEAVGWMGAVYGLRRRMQWAGGDRPDLMRLMNEALAKAGALKVERGVGRRMERTERYGRW